MSSVIQRSMISGEVSPRLGARSDVTKYQQGVKTLRNFQVTREGAAMNRSCTELALPTFDGISSARVIPFVFNNDDSFALVFQQSVLSFIKNGLPIFEATKNITGLTVATPPSVTCVAHGYATGDLVYIENVGGMTEVNGRFFIVTNTGANTFNLSEETSVVGVAYTAYTAGGTVKRVYRIASPYTAAEAQAIRFVQSADVMTLTHPTYAVRLLSRITDTNWTLAAASFIPAQTYPPNLAFTGPAGAITVGYQVTAVNATSAEESLPGNDPVIAGTVNTNVTPWIYTFAAHGYVTGDQVIIAYPVASTLYYITVTGANTFTLNGTIATGAGAAIGATAYRNYVRHNTTAFPTAVAPVTVTWSAVAGAVSYNIYRELNGVFGYVGAAGQNTSGGSFADLGYTADVTKTPPIASTIFGSAGNYPSCCGYYQQRSLYGGTNNDKEGNQASRSGLYYNFTKSNPIQDDDAISWTMASNQVNAIMHYLEMDRLFVFTKGAEYTVEGDSGGVLTPFAINARKRSQNGISTVRPLVIAQEIVYIQYGGNIINEIATGQQFGSFETRDLTVFSSHLFEGYTITDWGYAVLPFNIIWSVRSDGALLSLTYIRNQDVAGWARHDTGAGDKFQSIACIPEGTETAVYVAVQRLKVNGQTRTYIERMAKRTVLSVDLGKFLDSFRTYDSLVAINATAPNTYSLSNPSTNTWILTAAGGLTFTPGYNSPDIGKLVAFHLTDGTRIRCRVSEVIDTTTAYVDIATDALMVAALVAAGTFAYPYTSYLWSLGASIIYGLWHLEGRTVYALCDGSVEGPYTVTLGKITLSQAYSLTHVGLQIIADLETLPVDDPQNQTLMDKKKTVSKISALVERTDGVSIGLDVNHLNTWSADRFKGDVSTGRLSTGLVTVNCSGKTDHKGSVFVRQTKPLPVCVLGLIPTMTAGGA